MKAEQKIDIIKQKKITHEGCGGIFFKTKKRITENHEGYKCTFTTHIFQCNKCSFWFKEEQIATENKPKKEIVIIG